MGRKIIRKEQKSAVGTPYILSLRHKLE